MARSSSTRCRKPYGSVMTIAANQPSKDSASRIRRQFLASGDALTALAERSAEVDRLVMDAAQRLLFTGFTGSAAVLAVGGYGRRHLNHTRPGAQSIVLHALCPVTENRVSFTDFFKHPRRPVLAVRVHIRMEFLRQAQVCRFHGFRCGVSFQPEDAIVVFHFPPIKRAKPKMPAAASTIQVVALVPVAGVAGRIVPVGEEAVVGVIVMES